MAAQSESTKKSKPPTLKTPERVEDAYKRCIAEIENFQRLKKAYKQEIAAVQSMSLESQLKIAALKVELMQSIALIGDTLTWVRPPGRKPPLDKMGRGFYKDNKPLYGLASRFNDADIKTIIDLRNLYPHKFLYKGSHEKIEDFEKLFDHDTEQALAAIKNEMQGQLSQLAKKLGPNDHFTGVSMQGDPEPHRASDCWAVAIEELEVLEKLIANRDKLIKELSEKDFNKAVDACIKNICQVYSDFARQSELLSGKRVHSDAEWMMISVLHTASHFGFDTAQKDAMLYLGRSNVGDLRILLAHPNVLESPATKEARTYIVDNVSLLKNAFINLWKKANEHKKETGVTETYNPRSLAEFYSYVPSVSQSLTSKQDTKTLKEQNTENEQTENTDKPEKRRTKKPKTQPEQSTKIEKTKAMQFMDDQIDEILGLSKPSKSLGNALTQVQADALAGAQQFPPVGDPSPMPTDSYLPSSAKDKEVSSGSDSSASKKRPLEDENSKSENSNNPSEDESSSKQKDKGLSPE